MYYYFVCTNLLLSKYRNIDSIISAQLIDPVLISDVTVLKGTLDFSAKKRTQTAVRMPATTEPCAKIFQVNLFDIKMTRKKYIYIVFVIEKLLCNFQCLSFIYSAFFLKPSTMIFFSLSVGHNRPRF